MKATSPSSCNSEMLQATLDHSQGDRDGEDDNDDDDYDVLQPPPHLFLFFIWLISCSLLLPSPSRLVFVCINLSLYLFWYTFCLLQASKKQYHCDGCGICRIGGRENFFHCHKCGCCYSAILKNSHPCIEGAMHHDCPVCFEYLFDSTNDVSVMPCGHTIHQNCLNAMRDHFQFACPLCSKSVCDMSKVWEKFDMEIAATPNPEPYQNKVVWILCNDCGKTSKVQYHVVAQKCLNCRSYNTRLIG
ncbi:probable E3 ubiquitin-protein ligase RZFP34 [Cucurbita pepo subsp. pepo]|uniref:probable E3 ubiquitin-protein ligase RZFP34 n=1 Tax=Cucurbita pepo subsp. pepo TaxID=3664 RepID=UPI000C9D4765|nr:probable E3 ubiquitin-protein ligase RZFP34 [Cucurbita pepo subsp. pepo]